MQKNLVFLIIIVFSAGCSKNEPDVETCTNDHSLDVIEQRNFSMGFSTWSFGTTWADRDATYQFIADNADVYSEQIDNKIPWSAWINNTALPAEFTNDLAYRISKKPANHKLLLSVSLLNIYRDDLLEDYDGTVPTYSHMYDQVIEDAYIKHLDFLIAQFNPNYLVFAMEVNELMINSPAKWEQYKVLAQNLRVRIKTLYPSLMVSESITLHNWFNPEVDNPEQHIAEIEEYINQNLDFAAISFYAYFKGLDSKADFQLAFDFLHSHTTKPIAFSETAFLAEMLEIGSYNLVIPSDVCLQKDYLEVLLLNAYTHNYEFIIWWTFRDFDQLWETFPDELKDLGKIWRDTGLLDEDGKERPSHFVWSDILKR
jgi:hypothetical protein